MFPSTSNENIVHESARFFVEYQQIAQRLRLDIPTLSDPVVRDCLQESDLFVRSFNGMGSFGLLSPFDFIHIFALISELISHLLVLLSLTGGSANLGVLLLSLFSALFPLLLNRLIGVHSPPEVVYSPDEARTAERQERLRNLAYNESHRAEVLLFGLGPWVLESWTNARKAMLYDGRSSPSNQLMLSQLLNQINISDLLFALQNVRIRDRYGSCSDLVLAGSTSCHVPIDFCVAWIVGVVSEHDPGGGVHVWQRVDDSPYGISGNILDGRVLCSDEYPSRVGTDGRRRHKLSTHAVRNEN